MSLLAFLIAIFILVGFHEFGHFITAKWCGITVERFSIGFGPVLWRKKPVRANDTEFVLSLIPLGGYVKMLDNRNGDFLSEEQKLRAFNHQVLWKRSLVVLAGPLANFLLAWVLLAVLFLSSPIQVRPILSAPGINSMAAELGIVEGDEVRGFLELDSTMTEQIIQTESIQSWNRLRWKLLKTVFTKNGFVLELDHEGKGLYRVQFTSSQIQNINFQGDLFGQLGLIPSKTDVDLLFNLDVDIPTAFYLATERVFDISYVSLMSIKSLITGDASIKQITGPIGIAGMAGKSAQSGIVAYFGFLSLISISLGLMNLLPLPMLDGGQLVFDAWELVTGSPISEAFRALAVKVGLMGIILVTCIAFYNDFLKIFSG
ncbi:M50 family metallopeptidase [Polynucleobacter kasalickyi]|uniref:Site-2 protease. Metallo peptidase. MEROPS family M50B n=1 Tax=Polynucleobacter kasalickyi TaxID=1938817 RepID=A0A1W1ZCJ3_9BURK|nr:site-2 protease family protein [Polynucleobacter kasalickyi]SMC46123.1 site-2 protease. Metallo peptidase. MEROPS family M50B [Polynucleobacter kasalickyi]